MDTTLKKREVELQKRPKNLLESMLLNPFYAIFSIFFKEAMAHFRPIMAYNISQWLIKSMVIVTWLII